MTPMIVGRSGVFVSSIFNLLTLKVQASVNIFTLKLTLFLKAFGRSALLLPS